MNRSVKVVKPAERQRAGQNGDVKERIWSPYLLVNAAICRWTASAISVNFPKPLYHVSIRYHLVPTKTPMPIGQ